LKEQGRSPASEVGGQCADALIIAQVALSLVLVVVAGLFVATFQRLAHAPLGLDRDRVLVVTVTAPTVPATERNVFYHRLVRTIAGLPGIAAVGGSFSPPIVNTLRGVFVVSEPGSEAPPDAQLISQAAEVTPGWFAAYGMPIRTGRAVDDHDTLATTPVMVVNEAFVRRFLPGQSPIGKSLAITVRMGGDYLLGTKTIVGVVGDAVYRAIREPLQPTIYFPLAQRNGPLLVTNFFITLRASAGAPALLIPSVSSALIGVNRDLTVTFRPLATQVDESLAQDRLVATLSGVFGGLALLLAAVGLYGVTSYAVARRRAEIGIRAALGAAPRDIIRLVLKRAALLVAIGVVVGTGLSLWASTFVASLLYGLHPRDPQTLIGAAVLLAAVGALSGWIPAWRVSRIEPASVLRDA
jgi:predicted permease